MKHVATGDAHTWIERALAGGGSQGPTRRGGTITFCGRKMQTYDTKERGVIFLSDARHTFCDACFAKARAAGVKPYDPFKEQRQ